MSRSLCPVRWTLLLASVAMATLTASDSARAATIRGRITSCDDPAGGLTVEAVESLRVGVQLELGGRCIIGNPSLKSIGSVLTDPNGDYSISYTPPQRVPEICDFRLRVIVRVRDPDGRLLWASPETAVANTVSISRDVGTNCPPPPPATNDCGNGIFAPLRSPAYTISGTLRAPGCDGELEVQLYASVLRTQLGRPAENFEAQIASALVADGGTFSFALDYCRDMAPLFNAPRGVVQIPLLRLKVPDPLRDDLEPFFDTQVALNGSNFIRLTPEIDTTNCDHTLVRVVNEAAASAFSVQIFVDGVRRGVTNSSGVARIVPSLDVGDTIVARRRVHESESHRGAHDTGNHQDWSHRVYTTSLSIGDDGLTELHAVTDPSATQELVVRKDNALVGFNFLVSLEWDARPDEFATFESRFREASDFLYNATDGQFFIEEVTIVDNAAEWDNADFRVFANRCLRANAHVGALFGETCFLFFCKRGFMNVHVRNGAKVLMHEFGHFGFGLRDEYKDDHPEVNCSRLANVLKIDADVENIFEAFDQFESDDGDSRGRVFESTGAGSGAIKYIPIAGEFEPGDRILVARSGARATVLGSPVSPGDTFSRGMDRASCVMWSQGRTNKFCSSHPDNPHNPDTKQGRASCWAEIADRYGSEDGFWLLRSPEPGLPRSRPEIPGQIRAVDPFSGDVIQGQQPVPEWTRISSTNSSRPGTLCSRNIAVSFFQGGVEVDVDHVDLRTNYGQTIVEGKTGGFCKDSVRSGRELTGFHVGDTVRARLGDSSASRVITQADCDAGAIALNLDQGAALLTSVTPGGEGARVVVRVAAEPARLEAALVSPGEFESRPIELERDASGDFVGVVELPPGGYIGQLEVTGEGQSGNAWNHFETVAFLPVGGDFTEVASADGRIEVEVAAGSQLSALVSIGPSLAPLPPSGSRDVVVRPVAIDITGEEFSRATLRFWLSGEPGEAGLELAEESLSVLLYDDERVAWRPLDAADFVYASKGGLLTVRTREFGSFAVLGTEAKERPTPVEFLRGDANGDGQVNISDPTRVLGFLFLGSTGLGCDKAGDANDDGLLNISDPTYVLSALFLGGPLPVEPGESCGVDPTTDELTCDEFSACR